MVSKLSQAAMCMLIAQEVKSVSLEALQPTPQEDCDESGGNDVTVHINFSVNYTKSDEPEAEAGEEESAPVEGLLEEPE